MKYSLPRITAIAAGIVLALTTLAISQEEASRAAQFSGPELVRRAAAQMTQHPSLEAKIRLRINLFDQALAANGYYEHLRYDDENRFRLELRMQVGDKLTSLQQTNDGRYLWTRRDLGADLSLGRVDLVRIRNALKDRDSSTFLANPAWFGIGGLSQLLRGLSEHFSFGRAAVDEVNGIPVWRLQGVWNQQALARLFPDQAEQILAGAAAPLDKLPPHLPDRVRIVFDRGEKIPLFPYRIEFSRCDPATQRQRPMLAIDFFEVRLRPDFDPRRFTFQIGEQRVEDETEDFLQKLRLGPAKPNAK